MSHGQQQDKYEVLSNQFAKSGAKGLTDIITPGRGSVDLNRCALVDGCVAHLSA